MAAPPFTPTSGQQEILDAAIERGESTIVVSGPGTGKSRTAIEIAHRYLACPERKPTEQVLFLSFSNASIRRLLDASGVLLSRTERKQLRFMTYHSCAAELLRVYGRFVGLPTSARIADKLEERLIAIEEGWTDDDAGDEVDRLRRLAKERGILTFDVLIPLATRLLTASPTLAAVAHRRFSLIIVDEFQDTSAEQWELLQALGGGSQVVAFGDPNQIIYSSLHKATAARISEFSQWKSAGVVNLKGPNHRCASSTILDLADCIIDGRKFSPSSDDVQVIRVAYRQQLRQSLALVWQDLRTRATAGETIAFLASSNRLVEDIAVGLRDPAGSPVSLRVYVQMARDEAAHDAVFLVLAALRDFAVQADTHSAKRAAVALLAMKQAWSSRSRPKPAEVRRISKSLIDGVGVAESLLGLVPHLRAATGLAAVIPRFVEALGTVDGFLSIAKRLAAHELKTEISVASTSAAQLSLFDAIRSVRRPKGLIGDDARAGNTYALTYHKAKGREFDNVVMVVDPREESSKSPLDEQRRLYYVCATRAKKWLGIIHFGDYGRVLTPVLR